MEDFLKIFANYSQQDLLLQGMNTGKHHNVGFKQLEECCCNFFFRWKGGGGGIFSSVKIQELRFELFKFEIPIRHSTKNTEHMDG